MRRNRYAVCPVCGDVAPVNSHDSLWHHPRGATEPCAGTSMPVVDAWEDVSLAHARRAIAAPSTCPEIVLELLKAGALTTRQIAERSGYTSRRVRQALHELRARGLVDGDTCPSGGAVTGLHWLVTTEAA